MSKKAELKKVAVDKIVPHPDNPRVVLREDVVSAIVANLDGEWPQQHSLHLRPIGEEFQLLSGHQRIEAAKRKGMKHIWAWVEDMDDDAAFMLLVTSNNQGELSPLEIGIHALKAVTKEQGKKGGGLSSYAERIGKSKQYVGQIRQAAEVLSACKVDFTSFVDRAQHLCAIHKLHRGCWQAACEWLAENDKPVTDVEARVAKAVEFNKEFSPEGWDRALPKLECTTAVFAGTDPGNFSRLLTLYRKVSGDIIAAQNELLEEIRKDEALDKKQKQAESERIKRAIEEIGEDWSSWIIGNRGGDSWKIAAVQDKRVSIEERLWALRERPLGTAVSVLLADPPWQYDFAETDNRKVENQYPTATPDEIAKHLESRLLFPRTLADDCVLFLWATAPKLREALQVMEAWGFAYKTHAVWDKDRVGMGYWFRGQHELLLVGTRGEQSPPETDKRVSSVFRERRDQEHSAKPDCVYDALKSMFPDAERWEMYQREKRDGWPGGGIDAK